MQERFSFILGEDSIFFQLTSHVGIVEFVLLFSAILALLAFELMRTDKELKKTQSASGGQPTESKKSAFE
ncbi:MAG: hypothetical protein AAF668_09675 [Pseudomonadota bacterium]